MLWRALSVRRALLLAVAVVAAGCSPSMGLPDASGPDASTMPDAGTDAGTDAGRPPRDAGTPDAGFGPIDIARWCEADAVARCLREQRCLRISPSMFDHCVARRLLTCDPLALTRAVREGRLAYSVADGTRCLDAFGAGTCTETPAACAGVFRGLVPPDGGCVLASECNADGYCEINDGRCPHRCRGYAARGQTCDVFATIRCDPRQDVCSSPDGGALVCQPVSAADAGCRRSEECAPELGCQSGVCVRREARLGEACALGGFPSCVGDTFCRQDAGVCASLAGVGGACVDSSSCVGTLRCSGVISTGTCQGKLPLGAPCALGGDCEADLYCAGATSRCERLPGVDGGDCSLGVTGYRCDVGAFCLYLGGYDFECRPLRPIGAPCDYGAMCQSTECEGVNLPDGGFGRRCVERCAVRADAG